MKKFKTKRKGTNKGFSLIEVLCAVVLLGLIAAPFLQMIYSSYAANQKSKKYLAASDLCQTTLEAISAQTYEDSATIGSTSETVTGLASYYSGINKTGNKSLYQVPKSVGTVTPPAGFVPSHTGGDACNGYDKFIYYRNISYAGYRFGVELYFKESGIYSGGAPSQTYVSVPVKITVYDTDKNPNGFGDGTKGNYKILQTASTKVPNKR